MAESVTPAGERLEASVAGVSHTVSDVVGALLDNLPLVMEAAEEAGKAERIWPGKNPPAVDPIREWWVLR